MSVKKPTFLIVGSAKCGTTALASILGSHPDCCMSNPKEVSFFQDTKDYQPNPNFDKGWDWYQLAFSHYRGEPTVGEATPSYSDRARSPRTAQRIHQFNPDMKIIYMVRDPLKRQISNWKMQYAFGKERSAPWRREDQWALKGFDYWMRKQQKVGQWDECRYAYQYAAYEEFFPPENLFVSFLEDWKHNQAFEVNRIMHFVNLEPKRLETYESENKNRTIDRKINRPFLSSIRTNPNIQSIVKTFPIPLRSWARETLAKTKVNIPPADLSDTLKLEFINYIFLDSQTFLVKCDKPISIWPSLAIMNNFLTG